MTSNKEIYNSVDYTKVYKKANELLAINNCISFFPFKVSKLIKEQSDIRLYSYSKALSKYGINIKAFGSESAVLQEYGGANIVFYNDKEKDYRVRFDIMHEFGHFVFDHKKNLNKDDPLYQKQELEANCFAAQMLMPEQLLRECVSRGIKITTEFLMKNFGVSELAAIKRKNTLAKTNPEWRKREEKEFDDIILSRYTEFLEVIAPNRYSYDVEDEFEMQRERDSWYADSRRRW